jgi:hypothetical protein
MKGQWDSQADNENTLVRPDKLNEKHRRYGHRWLSIQTIHGPRNKEYNLWIALTIPSFHLRLVFEGIGWVRHFSPHIIIACYGLESVNDHR